MPSVAKRRRRCNSSMPIASSLSKEIGGKRSRGEAPTELEMNVREIGDQDCAPERDKLSERTSTSRICFFEIPNLPHANVPVGKDASDNPVVRSWGEKPALGGAVLDHVALGTRS